MIVIVVRMTAEPGGPGSDSVQEENEIEKQSGRPIQRQIPQSQRGKAKTVHVESNLSTAYVPPFQIFQFANGEQVM